MSLIPYDPFRQLSQIKKEFDQIFSRMPSLIDRESFFDGIRVDIEETENDVIVSCDLPGLESKDDVTITIDQQMLHISGMIKREEKTSQGNMHRQERITGRFHRTISLPSPVSEEGAMATYKNGVLEIKMPKIKNENRKHIDVEFH